MTDSTTAHVSDLVRQCFSAFLSKDRRTLEDLLSDDFTFNSPRDDHIGKTAYFERCFPFSGEIHAHHIEKLFVEGDEALVRYQVQLKDGTRFRNTEYIRIDGDQIKEIDVYFGSNITS
jgi:ketosteroid isomerase-like protein